MTTAVELLSFIPTGATKKRSLGDWTGDVVNVMNFTGVVANGSNDDTAGINAAIEAAFGPTNAANGTANQHLNKALYFPAGRYTVAAPAALTVTGAASASGKIRLTVSSIPGFGTSAQAYKTGHLCFVTGVGGVTHNGGPVSGNFGIIVDDATHITLRSSVFGGSYTSGGTVKRAALQMVNIDGGLIYGAGRATKIAASANTDSVLAINGMARTWMEGLTLDGGAGATTNVGMDLDWDYAAVSRSDDQDTQSTQGNTFANMAFNNCGYGARLGNHGQQVSENEFNNCSWSECEIAGLSIQNYNALQMLVIGGNMQACGIGINVLSGSCPIILGTGFQNGTGTDIKIENSATDGYFIGACRSESENFAWISAGPSVHLSGNQQIAAGAGEFLFYASGGINTCMIDGCYSQNGIISHFSNGRIWIRGGKFDNSGFIPSNLAGQIMQYDLGPIAVGSLPTAGTHLKGLRQLVTDSNATLATGHGNTVAGGGANICPVFCDGTNWKIG